MRVRAAVGYAHATLEQALRHGGGIFDDLSLQVVILFGGGDTHGGGQGGDAVDVWPALFAGEDGAVQLARQRPFVRNSDGAARPMERLVRGESDDVGDSHWIWVKARQDEPGHMRNIGEQICANFIGNRAVLLPIRREGVTGEAADDHFRPMLEGHCAHQLIIQQLRFGMDTVTNDVVLQTAAVDRATMRQMPTRDEIHAHHCVAYVE